MNIGLAYHRNPTILVIESDPEGRSLLRRTLSAADYLLNEAPTATVGLKQIEALQPDAILIDPMLPDMDGLNVIRFIRSSKYSSPIIVLSVKADEVDKITALDAGADDFMEKPFSGDELLARLRAALRRTVSVAKASNEPVFDARNLSVDFAKRDVRVDGSTIHLTPTEFRLLCIFVRYPNRVLSHAVLIKEVWDAECTENYVHSLRVYVGNLRRKVCAGSTACQMQTEAAIGYRLRTE
jgi:two-component system, OmpR family, KDP operon response regulator KdpE